MNNLKSAQPLAVRGRSWQFIGALQKQQIGLAVQERSNYASQL
jgi:hypothetical protein